MDAEFWNTDERCDLGAAILGMHAAIHLFRKYDICPYFVLTVLIHFINTKEIGIDIPESEEDTCGQSTEDAEES